MSKGDIVGILNSDDFYSKDTLELVAEQYFKEKYPLIVINGDMERVTDTGEFICRYHFTKKDVERKNAFGHPSMFAAKAVYDKIGVYDESFKLAADGEWQYRVHANSDIRYVVSGQVYNHMREGGASDNYKLRWSWFKERVRMKKMYKKSNLFFIILYELRSVIACDVKHLLPKNLISKIYRIIK